MSRKFIDISEHNKIISFNAIPETKLCGVIMKATEGTTFIDHAININYTALKGKIPIGFYHFLTSTTSPITQARNFWEQIRNKSYEIIPVLDVEQESLGDNAEIYSEQFLNEFYKLSGQHMLIYSGRCYIAEHFSKEFRENNVWWIADYSASVLPNIEGCNIVAWQYTEDERSYAFTMGNLDCNILINEAEFFIDSYSPNQKDTTIVTRIDKLQEELNKQGYLDKNGNKLLVDGVSGELTLSACPILYMGASGNLTAWVQLAVGVNNDGLFGKETRQAIITFQEKNSLDGDGIVGKNTWRKLLGL